MKPEYFVIAAIVLVAIVAAVVALYAWMTSPTKVLPSSATPTSPGSTPAPGTGPSPDRQPAMSPPLLITDHRST